MILEDKQTLKYLHAYKDGKIKQGLGINCNLMDRHIELYNQVDEWPAGKGEIIEYYEKHGTLE